jgi:orf22
MMAEFWSNNDRSYYLRLWVDQVSQNISDNSSQVRVRLALTNGAHTFSDYDCTASVTVDGQTLSWSGRPSMLSQNSSIMLIDRTVTIRHENDGKKTFSLSATFSGGGGWSPGTLTLSSNSFTLTTIPRSSSVRVGAGVIGSTITININRQNPSFKHTVRYSWAGKSGTIASNVDTSTSWTIPIDFANDIPNSASGTGAIYVDTYSGSTKTGTQSTTFTASVPANIKPDFTGISLSDLNGSAQNLIPKADTFIQVISNIKVGFNGAVGSYGSSITGYYAEIVGKNQSTSSNGGSLGIMNYHGTIKIRARVSDSRGRWSDTREVSVTVLEYFAPALSFSIARTGSTSSTLTVTRNAKVAPLTVSGSQKNTMTLTFKVARLGTNAFSVDNGQATGTWSSISSLVNSRANLSGNYLANQSWVVIGILEDKFTRTEFMVNVATESVVFSYDRSGVGINKIREQGALDVKGNIYADNKPIQQYQLTDNNGGLGRGSAQWNDVWNKQGTEFGWRSGKYDDNPTGRNGDWGLYQNFWLDSWKGVQFFTGLTSNRFFFRTYNNNSRWSPSQWKEIATKDDLQKIATRKIELGWFINGNVTRNGNLVTISTERKIADIATISDYREVKETIPAGFRPAQEVNLVLQGLSDSTVTGTAILHLASDGKIRLTSKSPGNKYWTGTITYITNDPYP